MKNSKLIGIFILLLFIGCNSDDRTQHDVTLSGEWKLIEVNGTIAGIRHLFEPGTIKWNFNASNHTFTVVNNNTDDSKLDVFDSGTYTYALQDNDATPETCSRTLVLEGTNYGCYAVTTTTLQINQGEADGIILKLIR